MFKMNTKQDGLLNICREICFTLIVNQRDKNTDNRICDTPSVINFPNNRIINLNVDYNILDWYRYICSKEHKSSIFKEHLVSVPQWTIWSSDIPAFSRLNNLRKTDKSGVDASALSPTNLSFIAYLDLIRVTHSTVFVQLFEYCLRSFCLNSDELIALQRIMRLTDNNFLDKNANESCPYYSIVSSFAIEKTFLAIQMMAIIIRGLSFVPVSQDNYTNMWTKNITASDWAKIFKSKNSFNTRKITLLQGSTTYFGEFITSDNLGANNSSTVNRRFVINSNRLDIG